MTLFSISIGTKGIWLEILNCELGYQFVHTQYEAPYVLISTPWFKFTASESGATYKKPLGKNKPIVWVTVKQWEGGGAPRLEC